MARIAVPWRAGCPDRQRALDWVRPRLIADGHDVTLGTCRPGPWIKAHAVDDAIDDHQGVVVIHDADVWVAPSDLEAAIAAVAHGDATWAIPHRLVHRLADSTSRAVYAGTATLPVARRRLIQRPYVGHAGGGIVVTTVDVWRRVPLDARFAGWGHEDDAWALALTELAGKPWRGKADLWHFWHPPQPRPARNRGAATSAALFDRYRRARGRDAYAALVADARRHLWEVAPA